MSNDSIKNIIGVALGVCLVCSILVATAAVVLKPKQVANQILEKRKNVLIAGDLMKKGEQVDVDELFSKNILPALIELKTGGQLPKEKMIGDLSPEKFDINKISKEPSTSQKIPADKDRANIRRAPLYMMVFFVKDGAGYSRIILPVYGAGLWSTMYGFIALDRDLKTVKGFTIYEHGETPGLGGEIENPQWQKLWKGKMAFDDKGQLSLKIIKGVAPVNSTTEIDGLSGATLTTRGVDNMIAYWFGPDGYGPFLSKLRAKKEM